MKFMKTPFESWRCGACQSRLIPVRVAVEGRVRCKACGAPLDFGVPPELVQII